MEKTNSPNRLIHEKSPYLLQHARNPVDWYPWGEEAFEKARREDKPVFLSIGYSTCHWCHVMEQESFEDASVAELMNDVFVSVKVDREERPDIDNVYMTVCRIMTGGGGWPLNIIMTPDGKPFFAASYIPRENRFRNAGMIELIPRIKQAWEERRAEVMDSAGKITQALRSTVASREGEAPANELLETAYGQLAGRFDETFGGFGRAPKFPTAHNFLFLLRYWRRTGDPKALEMVEQSLQEMRKGGIYDQIGFGFHRYSTDREWLVPHFEKMLYDQALLAMAYIEAYQATGKNLYEQTAREIFAYVLRDMTSPEGGFYSAEDADSEGIEGKFYVWTEKEIRDLLDKDDADLFVETYNISGKGNFTREGGKRTGANIPYLSKIFEESASTAPSAGREFRERLERLRKTLFAARQRRIHPHKDDKILADWNGLMIAALSKGAAAFDDPGYAAAAAGAVRLVMEKMRGPDGRLLHRFRDGDAAVKANADDYAFMTWGLLELYETSFDIRHLEAAIDLNRGLLKHHWDPGTGGLFFTPDDGEELIVRKKEIYDGAVPSANSVSMLNLQRLSRITGDSELEKKALQIGRAFAEELKQAPWAYTHCMAALDFAIGPSCEVVVVGDLEAEDTKKMLRSLNRPFIPNKVTIHRPIEESTPVERIPGLVRHKKSIDRKATAYICKDFACAQPTTDIGNMLALLGQAVTPGRVQG